MEEGVRRWLVDISQWNPSDDEFSFILSLLPHHEHSAITRFVKFEDRKRAVVSRLLRYALAHELLGIQFDEIIIKHTVEGKPYLETDSYSNLKVQNFNFNVSHHGDYVALAYEPLYLIGVDIVSLDIPKQQTPLEFLENFSTCLTSFEWDSIMNADTCNEMLGEFYKYWCLKEAFIKAIGTGLGYRLDRLEFHHTNWTNISVHIDGEESREWRFCLFELERSHWVSIARGHPRSAIESYRKTLRVSEFEDKEYHFDIQPNEFVLRTIEQLLPVSCRVAPAGFSVPNTQLLIFTLHHEAMKVSIARGHPRRAIESVQKTLRVAEFEDEQYYFDIVAP